MNRPGLRAGSIEKGIQKQYQVLSVPNRSLALRVKKKSTRSTREPSTEKWNEEKGQIRKKKVMIERRPCRKMLEDTGIRSPDMPPAIGGA